MPDSILPFHVQLWRGEKGGARQSCAILELVVSVLAGNVGSRLGRICKLLPLCGQSMSSSPSGPPKASNTPAACSLEQCHLPLSSAVPDKPPIPPSTCPANHSSFSPPALANVMVVRGQVPEMAVSLGSLPLHGPTVLCPCCCPCTKQHLPRSLNVQTP